MVVQVLVLLFLFTYIFQLHLYGVAAETSVFLIEPLGLMKPVYHNVAHLRFEIFFLTQSANRHEGPAI